MGHDICPIAAHGRMGRMDFMALGHIVLATRCMQVPARDKEAALVGITLCHLLCRRAFPPPRSTHTSGSR